MYESHGSKRRRLAPPRRSLGYRRSQAAPIFTEAFQLGVSPPSDRLGEQGEGEASKARRARRGRGEQGGRLRLGGVVREKKPKVEGEAFLGKPKYFVLRLLPPASHELSQRPRRSQPATSPFSASDLPVLSQRPRRTQPATSSFDSAILDFWYESTSLFLHSLFTCS
ncbi:hypothetical protein ACLB2K_008950 [Fragaria x ananassa]